MPGPETAVLLIAHGSRKATANQDLHRLAEEVRLQGGFAIVEPSFLELAEPDIRAGGVRCVEQGARRVLMVPYFLGLGMHVARDLTAARDELSGLYPEVHFELGKPLGPDPLLTDLVLQRVDELAGTEDAANEDPSEGNLVAVHEGAPGN